MDVHTKEQRSYNMSRVRSKNTLPEKLIFKALKERGIKFVKHNKRLPGKPDISFPDKKTAVFINGEFWHGKNFQTLKRQLSPFWKEKIGRNLSRDRRNQRLLNSMNWHVINLWGKKIVKSPESALRRILRFLDKISPGD